MSIEVSRSQDRSERGFSLIELLMVVGIFAIILAIAIPHMLSSRATAKATGAMGDLKTIHSAQIGYFAGAGLGSYGTLSQLEATGLLSGGFGSSATQYVRFDYTGTLTLGSSNGTFSISSVPAVINSNTPAYFLDESGSLRYSRTAAAGSASTPVGQ